MRPNRRLIPIAVVALTAFGLLAACSSGDDSPAATGPATTEPATSQPDTTPATTAPATTAPATTQPATTQPATTTEPEPGPPRLAGLAEIELTTAHRGGGQRPLLEWSAVEGADTYGVYLYAPDETIYWSWQGGERSVFVGGENQLPDSVSGPSVIDGMTWSVVAYDAALVPVGSSELRPIAP